MKLTALIELGFAESKIALISYGAEIPSRVSAYPEKSPCKLVAVMRFVAKKSPSKLLEAFKIAYQKMPQLSLEIIGEGPLLKDAVEFVKRNNLDKAVTFYGAKDYNFVKRTMRSSCVFVQHKLFLIR